MLPGLLERVINWLKAGYPQGVPTGDYIPLVALLKRRLTPEEIEELGAELELRGMLPADHVDVGSRYIKMVDEVPSIQELERVTTHLQESGWPVDDPSWTDTAG